MTNIKNPAPNYGPQGVFNAPVNFGVVPPHLALHQLRAPVGDFVGREREINELVQALGKAASGGAAAIGGVRGMGGIGKTELAYAIAQRLVHQFPAAQLLLDLRGTSASPLSPEQALQILIRTFEHEDKLPDDRRQLQARYRSLLSGRQVLILADDAGGDEQIRPLLPPPGCALLVTSRNRFSVPGMRALDLETLPQDEAERLLMSICRRIGEHAGVLAKLCGYLPLALRVSASLLETNDTRDVARYLKQLELERLKYLTDPNNPNDPQASVEASLRLSYDALEPRAQAVLRQLSVFPTSFDLEAAKVVVKVVGDVEKVLELLRWRSLLEWDTTVERFNLHDLVRAFAVAELRGPTNALRLDYARHYAGVAAKANTWYLQKDKAQLLAGLALFDCERVHIDAGWHWAREQAGNSDTYMLLLEFANATVNIGPLRYNTRRERIPQLEAALTAAQRLRRRDAEGATLGNLGNAHKILGDTYKAIGFYKQALAVARELGDRRGEAFARWNLGLALEKDGDLEHAVAAMQASVDIKRAIGHPTAEKDAATLEQVRQWLAD